MTNALTLPDAKMIFKEVLKNPKKCSTYFVLI